MLRPPCILGGPQTKQDEIRNRYLTPTFSEAQKKRGNATSTLHSWGSLNKKGSEMLRQTRILGGPQTTGGEIRSGYLTPTFSGAKKRAEMLRQPCILGGRKQRGMKSEVATSPLPSRRPKRGRKCCVNPTFLGVPK